MNLFFFKRIWLLGSIISIAACYLLVFMIAYNTPMHSDDFYTTAMGFPALENLSYRYLHWSGRIVADLIASFLLWPKNHLMTSLLNAMGIPILISIISFLSISIAKIERRNFPVLFWAAFLIYWIFNPNLGQVSFWVVGASNYTWTSVIYFVFILAVFVSTQSRKSLGYFKLGMLFILGMMAGCTNENMGGGLIFILIFMYFSECYIGEKKYSYIVCGLLGAVIGYLVLIGAPGNMVRMSLESPWWLETGLVEKIKNGIGLNLYAYKKDSPILFLISILIFVSAVFKKVSTKSFYFAIVFLIAAFIANVTMFASPAYPPRAMNGQFILLICCFVTLLANLIKFKKKLKIVYAASLFVFIAFVVDYGFMFSAYRSAYNQGIIREGIIKKSLAQRKTDVIIPDYFFRPLLKGGEKFDLYRPDFMKEFYKTKNISYQDPLFDYSILLKDGGWEKINSSNDRFYVYTSVPFYSHVIVVESSIYDKYNNVLLNIKGKISKFPLSEKSLSIEGKYYRYTKVYFDKFKVKDVVE